MDTMTHGRTSISVDPRSARTSGFTIVELLIVIVIIGILAAITIVAYNGIQNRANDTVIKNDLKQSYTKIQAFYALNSSLPASQAEINDNLVTTRKSYGGGGNFLLYCRADNGVAAIVGRSTSGNGFAYSSNGGAITFSSWPGDGNANLCPAAGIPTTTSGYAVSWLGVNGGWEPWYTPGR